MSPLRDILKENKKLRRGLTILARIAAVLAVALLIYFPGRQTPIAGALATGIGISRMQARVDQLEAKAINKQPFTDDDKRFLRNLYVCFAKGGRLTIVLRQSSQMMRRYLSATGEDLETSPRIFVNSRPVQQQIEDLKQTILADIAEKDGLQKSYASQTFYMGDPKFFDAFVGLYFGRVIAEPSKTTDGTIAIRWRAECPWQWPAYPFIEEKYGDAHGQCFPIPNPRSILFGARHCLWLDDGLGEHLAHIGIAKPFLVYSEWDELVVTQETQDLQGKH